MKILKTLLVIIVAVSISPYLIPLPKPDGKQNKVFDNSRYLTVSETSLHFQVWEPTRTIGKILLVHGLAGSTFSFRNNVQPLVDAGYRVVTVDLPGFGYSDRARKMNHSQETRAKLLWELLDQLDQEFADNGKWHLLGHSMGAGTVTAMALARETNVSSMIYVDGIWGEKDTWVPVGNAHDLEKLIPGFQLHVLADAWHCPMETKPEIFNEFLLDALKQPFQVITRGVMVSASNGSSAPSELAGNLPPPPIATTDGCPRRSR